MKLALYLLFGAILYFPLKLLKIKDEISNQISFDDANAMGSIETLPNSTENLIEMSQPIITSGTLETYSTANTTMMTSTSRPLTSCITSRLVNELKILILNSKAIKCVDHLNLIMLNNKYL